MRNYSSIISSSLGNILEWYDFGLFTLFSSIFSQVFFPSQNPHTAIIATVGIFAIGFFCRPLGALLFGYLGDSLGRAQTLRLSILMIALPTLFISFIPSYESIGMAAPILLMLIRMWQGISIGGEYSGNLIYLAESAPPAYRAFFTSFASMGSNAGILLATLVGLVVTHYFSSASLMNWGWRLPYLFSGLLCLIIYIFRLRLQETQIFDYLKANHKLVKNPIKTTFLQDYPQLLRTLGLVCMGTTFYYFSFVYIPIFLTQNLHYPLSSISLLMSTLIACMIILVPFAGLLCDKLGRKKMLVFNASFIILITLPAYYFLQVQYIPLFASLILLTIASALEQGTTPIAIIENFPSAARYTGVSLGYNIGNGLLGGTVPIICEWLINVTGLRLSPAFYIVGCALLTLLVVLFFIKDTRHSNLEN